eukprot:scaffold76329_cov59-Attheya_sp.AAC.3
MVRYSALVFVAVASVASAFTVHSPFFVAPSSTQSKVSQLNVLKEPSTVDAKTEVFVAPTPIDVPPFKKVMAANRAEIAVRIMRACTELNMGTVAIYGHEDRYSQHRWGADQSFMLEKEATASPISAYLDIAQIIQVAKDSGVEAIHPGYGFLSESPEFAQACADNGITFIGPTIENLNIFADKTSAREAAIAAGVPVVPGSDGPITSAEDITEFVKGIGLPIIIKAAMGGGGKGMRVVRNMEDLVPSFESASSEALAAFGDGSVFVERFVDRPRHIEVQIIGDGTGNVVHLWERDCSIQRRHQKVIEMAPAWSLPMELREQLHDYATRLTSAAKYKNAGTVEFLIDSELRPYFIEVNPRIQVEHTVTEEVTGIDVVKTQMQIAAGKTLEELGLIQEDITVRGVAIQCRITTENPEKDFAPDTGTISVYRHSAGCGIRMDGCGYTGLAVTPYYDSMIVKYTARGATFKETVARMRRALQECKIRGVKTNIPFLLNVMTHPDFESGIVTTSFIDENPQLKQVSSASWNFATKEQKDMKSVLRVEKLMRYLANLAVNGHPEELGADASKIVPGKGDITKTFLPTVEPSTTSSGGMRKILLEKGPAGYAKAVREHKGLLITDTTWRDAHQSLLATRMRTKELERCAPYSNAALSKAFSMEMWGGATFDVAMRFLHECPWERLERLREKVPDVPFQMLLRGANAVGYTNYPDNMVHKFCDQAHKSGVDIFRVFDSLNYLENLKLGVDAAGSAGGFVEGAISYTGDVSDPSKGKYNLEYYIKLARDLEQMGVHSLAIKDMAGLLNPRAASLLVGAIRAELPDMPIHVHTHDTSGTGVASMIAAAEAGADIVDAAMDAMSGLTSQPSLGAIVNSVRGTDLDTGIDMNLINPLNTYWENVRSLYVPFESGQLSGSSDVYNHEIPGGQNLDAESVLDQADTLGFPESVVQYLRGEIGVPPGGFPEPLRSKVLSSRNLEPIEGRPGASLADYDFEKAKQQLDEKYTGITDKDVLSHAMYPDVFVEWKNYEEIYGQVSVLPTNLFLNPMKEGDEVELTTGFGLSYLIKLASVKDMRSDGTRTVAFTLNGEQWFIPVTDHSSEDENARREKAGEPGTVGAPMPGVVVSLKVKIGDLVKEGEAVATLSAMKMETVIMATASGKVDRLLVNVGDKVDGDDLIMSIV